MLLGVLFNLIGSHHIYDPEFFFSIEGTCFREACGGGATDASVPDEVIDFFRCVLAAAECGYETIMINCNPETVSTDFDTADKLYFEPVFWEHIYDIIQHENPVGVIVQLGGQTALKLAEKLSRYGIKIMGTSFESLDLAEDRGSFSTLLKKNNIPYPEFGVAETPEQALQLAEKLSV